MKQVFVQRLVSLNIFHAQDISTSKVFISYIKPYKPVAPATIARRLKSVLSSAGIDTNMFKAHSVRGATTSAAYDKGAPIEKILKLANWSNEKTFYKKKVAKKVANSAHNAEHIGRELKIRRKVTYLEV